MLKIRKEQNDELSDYMLQQFENRMVVHLRDEYPEETQLISEEQLRTLIKAGIRKAETYGIELENDVQEFIEFMVVYGSDFDTNSKFHWAREILDDPDLDGSDKMDEITQQEAFLAMDRQR